VSGPAKDEAELIGRIACGIIYLRGSDNIAIAAIRAIRDAGWAVVPAEPTEEMLWAAHRAPAPPWEMGNPDHLDSVRRIEWAAMLAATPGGQQERRAKALAELAEMDADLLDQPTPGGEAVSADNTADLEHWQEVCYAHEAELQWLRADVKRLGAENARLREALEQINQRDTYPPDGYGVWAEIARAALAGEVKP
jgi:hypothetical protein